MTDPLPLDQPQRLLAVDPARSILVQAPAGSGKTTLLTQRFLSLLAEVDQPGQVVAITFTTAAAAEMRNRILDELRSLEPSPLALRVIERSNAGGWRLLDLPAQLRISTIDSFCREIALQQPLLSGLGGSLDIAEQPDDLFRRAARRTIEKIDSNDRALCAAISELLLWRDNNWQEVENKLVEMLAKRDRWMLDFVLDREPDWPALRERLERPFVHANRSALNRLDRMLAQLPGRYEEALELARFACGQPFGEQHRTLAELAEFPTGPFAESAELETARDAFAGLSLLLLTKDGAFRKQIDKRLGFPAGFKAEKERLENLISDLCQVAGCESALSSLRNLPPLRYSEDDWKIVRACFTLLRHAAIELQVVFAEAAKADYVEVAQVAQRVLRAEGGFPSEAALSFGEGIRHLLVDEFQDTSRRQHHLLAALVAAWAEPVGRTLFVVGDPTQSIYSFRDADPELFARVRENGLEVPGDEPTELEFVPLWSNFRTLPGLIGRLNEIFIEIFPAGKTAAFSPAAAGRQPTDLEVQHQDSGPEQYLKFHLDFVPQGKEKTNDISDSSNAKPCGEEVGEFTRALLENALVAREPHRPYRIGVLGRTKRVLGRVAEQLRAAGVSFRAVELEGLGTRQEVLDVVALGRALLSPFDRVSWLGVLRAPWCGLDLKDLHMLASADDPGILARPVPELLAERVGLLSEDGQKAARRVLDAVEAASRLRAHQPTATLGTWLQQVWRRLGGDACVDQTGQANLDLLWSCLDKLPEGAQDLLGPALAAALARLTALPDPGTDSDFGVQLMTIHKSKGLEFEVVIIPEMQARTKNRRPEMLSWLERGLAEPDESGEITEFLVAPQQSKGDDAGSAKRWVDSVREEREREEERRVFYVAATRARDQLHLFARPQYREDKNGDLTLVEPRDSLLSAAWPGLRTKIEEQFEAWKAERATAADDVDDDQPAPPATAGGTKPAGTSLVIMPLKGQPTMLRRLPPDYCAPEASALEALQPETVSGLGKERLYQRHEGGMESRAMGTAVHMLLEEMAAERISLEWSQIRANLPNFQTRLTTQIRAVGIDRERAARLAAEAISLALEASSDPDGQWILSPRPRAASEVRWAGLTGGRITNVRVDRVFRAGLTPRSEGDQAWWIFDYKTAHADAPDPAAALPGLRALFAPQLEAYGQILRNLHGADAVLRAGLYYPRMRLLDWWEM